MGSFVLPHVIMCVSSPPMSPHPQLQGLSVCLWARIAFCQCARANTPGERDLETVTSCTLCNLTSGHFKSHFQELWLIIYHIIDLLLSLLVYVNTYIYSFVQRNRTMKCVALWMPGLIFATPVAFPSKYHISPNSAVIMQIKAILASTLQECFAAKWNVASLKLYQTGMLHLWHAHWNMLELVLQLSINWMLRSVRK